MVAGRYLPSESLGCCRVMGDFDSFDDLNFTPKSGDIGIQGDKIWLYTGFEWLEMAGTSTLSYNGESDPKQSRNNKKLVNCKNCGAPSGCGDHCEYCGSLLLEGDC